MKNVAIYSTNHQWKVVDLQDGRKINKGKSEHILFKECNCTTFTCSVTSPKDMKEQSSQLGISVHEDIVIVDNVPAKIRFARKLKALGQQSLCSQIEVLLDNVAFGIDCLEWMALLDYVNAVLSCMSRIVPVTFGERDVDDEKQTGGGEAAIDDAAKRGDRKSVTTKEAAEEELPSSTSKKKEKEAKKRAKKMKKEERKRKKQEKKRDKMMEKLSRPESKSSPQSKASAWKRFKNIVRRREDEKDAGLFMDASELMVFDEEDGDGDEEEDLTSTSRTTEETYGDSSSAMDGTFSLTEDTFSEIDEELTAEEWADLRKEDDEEEDDEEDECMERDPTFSDFSNNSVIIKVQTVNSELLQFCPQTHATHDDYLVDLSQTIVKRVAFGKTTMTDFTCSLITPPKPTISSTSDRDILKYSRESVVESSVASCVVVSAMEEYRHLDDSFKNILAGKRIKWTYSIESMGHFSKSGDQVGHVEYKKVADIDSGPLSCVYSAPFLGRVHEFVSTGLRRPLDEKVEKNVEFLVEQCLYEKLAILAQTSSVDVIIPPPIDSSEPVVSVHISKMSISSDTEPEKGIGLGSTMGVRSPMLSASFPNISNDFSGRFAEYHQDIHLSRVDINRPEQKQLLHAELSGIVLALQDGGDVSSTQIMSPASARVNVGFYHWYRRNVHELGVPQLEFGVELSPTEVRLTRDHYHALLRMPRERIHIQRHHSPVVIRSRRSEPTSGASLAILAQGDETPAPPVPVLAFCRMQRGSLELVDLRNGVNEVIMALAFHELDVCYEGNTESHVLKGSTGSLIMRSPEHDESPFRTLVTSSSEHRHGILLRYDRRRHIFDDLDAGGNVFFRGIRVGLIVRTIEEIRDFFTMKKTTSKDMMDPTEELLATHLEGEHESHRSTFIGDTRWNIRCEECELLATESPDSPECLPLVLHKAQLEGKGVEWNLNAPRLQLFTLLWHERSLRRNILTEDFPLVSTMNFTPGNRAMDFYVEDITVDMSRRQFMLILNIVEQYLSSLQASQEQRMGESPDGDAKTTRKQRSSSRILPSIKDVRASLLTGDRSSYSSIIVRGADEVTHMVITGQVDRANLILRELSDNENSEAQAPLDSQWIPFGRVVLENVNLHDESGTNFRNSILCVGTTMVYDLRWRERFCPVQCVLCPRQKSVFDLQQQEQQQKKRHSGSPPRVLMKLTAARTRSLVQYVCECAAVQAIYVPEFSDSVQKFLTLTEDQKLLRQRYMNMKRDLEGIFTEGIMADEAVLRRVFLKRQLSVTSMKRFEQKRRTLLAPDVRSSRRVPPRKREKEYSVVAKVMLEDPLLIFPEHFEKNIFYLMEVSVKNIFVSNDNMSVLDPELTVTDFLVRGMEVVLETADLKEKTVYQRLKIAEPMNVDAHLNAKPSSLVYREPFAFWECKVDQVRAVMSIGVYETLNGIVAKYTEYILQQRNAVARKSQAGSSPRHPVQLFEVSVKYVDISLISDFVVELDLFYAHGKDVRVKASVEDNFVSFHANTRLEILINNPNYMVPEPLFDPFECTAVIRQGYIIDAERTKRKIFELEFITLTPLSTHVTKEMLQYIREVRDFVAERARKRKGVALDSADDERRKQHYQYRLVNETGGVISVVQTGMPDERKCVVEARQDNAFSFSNPFLPKCIDIHMEGWSPIERFSIESGGIFHRYVSRDVLFDQGFDRGRRSRTFELECVIQVETLRLQRVVTVRTAFSCINVTEFDISIRSTGARAVADFEVDVPSGKSISIPFHEHWSGMNFFLRPNPEWNWSRGFTFVSARKRDSAFPITIKSPRLQEERVVIVSCFQNRRTECSEIKVEPPLVLKNLSHFDLVYYLPHVARGGLLEAHECKPIYSSCEKSAGGSVSFQLGNFKKWSKNVVFHRPSPEIHVRFGDKDRRMLTPSPLVDRDHVEFLVSVDARVAELARTLTINSSYLLVNRTELPLMVRQRGWTDGVTIPAQSMRPFSLSSLGTKQIEISVGPSSWSDSIPFGTEGYRVIHVDVGGNVSYNVTMRIRRQDKSSFVVTWKSSLELMNLTDYAIVLQIGSSRHTLKPKTRAESNTEYEWFMFSLDETEGQWSHERIPLTKADHEQYFVRLIARSAASDELKKRTFRVTVKSVHNQTHIQVEEMLRSPYLLVNRTDHHLEIQQALSRSDASCQLLEPMSTVEFFWFDQIQSKFAELRFVSHPAVEGMKSQGGVLSALEDEEIQLGYVAVSDQDMAHHSSWSKPFRIDEIGNFRIQIMNTGSSVMTQEMGYMAYGYGFPALYAAIHAQKETKLIVITEDAPAVDPMWIHRTPHVGSEETISGSNVIVKLHVPSCKLQVLDSNKNEIVYGNVDDVRLHYSRRPPEENIYMTIQKLHVDNMIPKSEYQVLLTLDTSKTHELNANMIEILHERLLFKDFVYTQYFGVRALPMIVKIDGEVLTRLSAFVDVFRKDKDEMIQQSYQDINHHSVLVAIPEEYVVGRHQDLVIEDRRRVVRRIVGQSDAGGSDSIDVQDEEGVLLIDGRKSHEEIDAATIANLKNKLLVYVQRFQVFPVEFVLQIGENDFRLPPIHEPTNVNLSSFNLYHALHPSDELVSQLIHTYAQHSSMELYKILGSIDVIGSPLGVIAKVGSGLRDFIMMPYYGLILDDSPGAFAVGVVKGTVSLLRNLTAAGLATLIKLSNVMSTAFTFLTFDTRYRQRKAVSRRQHPPNPWQGLIQGSNQFVYGLFDGLAGIFIQPVRGARDDDCRGFTLGCGRGIIGIPLKPCDGVFSFLSKSLEGFKNFTDFAYKADHRQRELVLGTGLMALTLTELETVTRDFEESNPDQSVEEYFGVTTITSRDQLRRMILALSNRGISLLDPDLIGTEYVGTQIPYSLILQVELPRFSAYITFDLSQPCNGKIQLRLIIPERDRILEMIRTLYMSSMGVDLPVSQVEFRPENRHMMTNMRPGESVELQQIDGSSREERLVQSPYLSMFGDPQ
eukprot:TRINITY_DN15506_c0_g1_i1.p1 TRINITY_DN15506_c0_g1~~TRINITY_DN15506_c0_g1_i1.p1  ORF type:complete len:2959 (+),score=713.77 TRINITY_DN15506_c0_g1_i1:839-9715(+)